MWVPLWLLSCLCSACSRCWLEQGPRLTCGSAEFLDLLSFNVPSCLSFPLLCPPWQTPLSSFRTLCSCYMHIGEVFVNLSIKQWSFVFSFLFLSRHPTYLSAGICLRGCCCWGLPVVTKPSFHKALLYRAATAHTPIYLANHKLLLLHVYSRCLDLGDIYTCNKLLFY